MPVTSLAQHKKVILELHARYHALREGLEPRELTSPTEGCSGRRRWAHPELMCATEATHSELRLLIDDFNTILRELKRL